MREVRKTKKLWLIGWIAFGFVALILALLSTGGGHGDYIFVKLFFPITMYTWYIRGKFPCLMMILPFIQYPMVGLVPFIFARKRRKYFYIIFLVINIYFLALVLMRENYSSMKMPGVYTAGGGYKDHMDSYYLELREDGTYTQEIIDLKGKKHTNNGEWEFDWLYGEPSIKTHNFMILNTLSSSPLYSESRIFQVKPSMFGRRQLWFGESLIFSYKSPPKEKMADE